MFNVIINSEQYDEFMAQKEKIKELEAQIKEPDELQAKIKELENWNNALLEDFKKQRDKNSAQIKECNELRIENDELKNKVIRFNELVIENYRLKMSINDLKANNKELKAKINEPVATITINHCCDSEEALKNENNNLKEHISSKDIQIDFLKSKVDWLNSRFAVKETKDIPEVKPGLMYLMPAKDASKLCDALNRIEERLNALENYIFGGKNNGGK